MTTYNVEINNRPNKDGLCSVFIKVTQNRKRKRIKLNFTVPADHFNKAAKYGKWIRMANSKFRVHNKEIEDTIEDLKKREAELIKQELPVLANIKSEVKSNPDITLKTYFDKFLLNLEADSSIGYYRHVKSKLNRFVEYFKDDFPIKKIDPSHIAEYKSHLLLKGLSGTTVNDNLMRVHTVFKLAISDDTIIKDPFRAHTRAKVEPSNRIKLSDEQIKTLEEMELPVSGEKNWLHNTRNYYLFSYYNAGIRIADLIQLRQGSLAAGRLEYENDKTGHGKSIQLTKKSLQLLKDYIKPGAQPHEYLFPILDSEEEYAKFVTYAEKRKMDINLRRQLFRHISSKTALINKNLGFLSTKMKLEKSISFHTSRHSFADKARRAMKNSKKITIVDIMNSLGHKKISTTQIYLNSFDKESLDEAMGDIFD